MDKNKKKTLYNIVFGFGGQFVILLMGIVLPRIMLTNYGSDVNGLTNTVLQIFTYMSLLEAGIGQATKNALYEPIAEKRKDKISYVMSVSRYYFRRITVYYAIGVLLLASILPFILKSDVHKGTIFLVVLLEGMTGIVSFYYLQSWMQLLVAEGRGYIKSNAEVISKIAGYIAKIVLASLGVNIVFLQAAFFVISLGKLAYFRRYFRKKYNWIDYKAAPKTAKLKDRNAYIVSEVAWTIFSSTDMIVLSVFVSTQMSSVYSIYNLVFQNLSVLLGAVYTGTVYILGQVYFQNIKKYIKLHDSFNSIFMGLITILMSVAYLLIIPFINLYTDGVTDINYIYSELPILFCLVQILSWGRYVGENLIAISGNAKMTAKISLIEAGINLFGSVIFVNKFGITGVLIATVCALPLKLIIVTCWSNIKILHRSAWKSAKIFLINIVAFICTVIAGKFIVVDAANYLALLVYGAIFTIIVSVFVSVLNIAVNPSLIDYVKNVIKKKFSKNLI